MLINIDEPVKSRKILRIVFPAKEAVS